MLHASYKGERKSQLCSKEVSFPKAGGDIEIEIWAVAHSQFFYHLDWEQIVPQHVSLEKNISCRNGETGKSDLWGTFEENMPSGKLMRENQWNSCKS